MVSVTHVESLTVSHTPGRGGVLRGVFALVRWFMMRVRQLRCGIYGHEMIVRFGPGRIWLHSMTVSKVAHRVAEYLPGKSG